MTPMFCPQEGAVAHHCPDVEAAYLDLVARAFQQAAPTAAVLLTASASTKKGISPEGSFLLAGPAGGALAM